MRKKNDFKHLKLCCTIIIMICYMVLTSFNCQCISKLYTVVWYPYTNKEYTCLKNNGTTCSKTESFRKKPNDFWGSDTDEDKIFLILFWYSNIVSCTNKNIYFEEVPVFKSVNWFSLYRVIQFCSRTWKLYFKLGRANLDWSFSSIRIALYCSKTF